MDKVLQHIHSTKLHKNPLVVWTAGGQVPECSAGIANDCQTWRTQVLQKNLETAVLTQDGAVVFANGNVAADISQDAPAVLDDGQRLQRTSVGEVLNEKLEGTFSGTDVRFVLNTVRREIPERTEQALEC